MNANKVVIKIGTSTLTYSNGKLNLRRVENLCKVISDLKNSGKQIVLVSSGAVGVGVGKLGLESRPKSTKERQALAAVGQCELMFIYSKFFGTYGCNVAQLLLTRDIISNEIRKWERVTPSLQHQDEMENFPINIDAKENSICSLLIFFDVFIPNFF